MDTNLAAACGLYCGACEFLGNQCPGCSQQKGKPFWTTQFGLEICPIYDCCLNSKRLEHCGLCPELPCKAFTELRDPSLSDEEAEKSLHERQDSLLRRRDIGTEKWLEERV